MVTENDFDHPNSVTIVLSNAICQKSGTNCYLANIEVKASNGYEYDISNLN